MRKKTTLGNFSSVEKNKDKSKPLFNGFLERLKKQLRGKLTCFYLKRNVCIEI